MKQVNIKPEMITNWNDMSIEAHELFTKRANKSYFDTDTGDLLLYRGDHIIARAEYADVSGNGHIVIEYLYDKFNNKELYDICD